MLIVELSIVQWYACAVVLGTSGSGSVSATPVAVPVFSALELPKAMVKPIGMPASTGTVWSAVLVRLRLGPITDSVADAVSGQAVSFVQATVAVFRYEPALAESVWCVTCTEMLSPGAIEKVPCELVPVPQ